MHNRDSCRNASQAGNIVYSAGEGLLPACGFMCPSFASLARKTHTLSYLTEKPLAISEGLSLFAEFQQGAGVNVSAVIEQDSDLLTLERWPRT